MQERAVEEVKLAIKPFYQKRDINKEEYKEILRKAVQKVRQWTVFQKQDGFFMVVKYFLSFFQVFSLFSVLCPWLPGVPQQEWGNQSSQSWKSD